MIDEEDLFGLVLNGASDPLTVLRAEDEGPEDEEIERALQEGDSVALGRISFSG